MKRVVLSLLSLFSCFATSLHAQVGLAYIQPTYQLIQSKSFSAFANSYAAVNGASLSSWKTDQMATGFTIGGGISSTNSPILLGIEYSRAKSRAEFNFNNNARRSFSLHANMLNFKSYAVIGNLEQFPFAGMLEFGIGMGRAVIKSDFEQGDTPINSAVLDGKYTGFHGEVSAGLSLLYMFGPVGLKATCTYNLSFFATRLDDKEKESDFDSLPQDFTSFVTAPDQYIGEEVKDDFRYLKYGLGVILVLD
jgi:hypothetical protein